MKYKFAVPLSVGDLIHTVIVDEVEVQSISITFDPQNPVLSVVLLHKSTGWQHNVVYRDSSAVEFWAKTYEAEFDLLHKVWLQKLVNDQKLPAGEILEK